MRVDWRQSVSLVGTVVKYLAAAMLIPLFVGIVYGDDVVVFVVSILLTVVIGVALEQVHSETKLHPREALPFAALSWLVVAIVGSIPYVLAGWGRPPRSRTP